MKLKKLIKALSNPVIINAIDADITLTGVAFDSRQVQTGNIFVAFSGNISDGHHYIHQAIRNGAAAVVVQDPAYADTVAVPYLVVPDSRAAVATAAAVFYDFPAHKLRMIGVTGTDGKTTTSTLIHAILSAAGYQTDMITTIEAKIGDESVDVGLHVTTPDAVSLQRYLAQMVTRGADYAVIEATSHGLAQDRVKHCSFDVATLTNITHEHLDYHGAFKEYQAAKLSLIRNMMREKHKDGVPKVSMLNADDPSFNQARNIATDKTLSYGLDHPADYTATHINYTPLGTTFTAHTPNGNVDVTLALIGRFNIYNALAAIAVAHSQGVSLEAIQQGIAGVQRIHARMERIDEGQPYEVFVDYAHTPNAIEQALSAARQFNNHDVVAVCGLSGGLRDKTKRADFGEIVGGLADKTVITAMDWYTEDVSEIMNQIAVGCVRAGRKEGVDFWCFRDREEGIRFGIELAAPGDIVVVAGKAHESSISSSGISRPWNELAVVRKAIGQSR